MPRATMVVTGDKALNRKLQRLRGPQQKKAVRQASREALKAHLLQPTRRAAPRRSGRLQRAVKVRALPRSRKALGARVTVGDQSFQGETFYAGFVELGRKTGKRGSSNRRQVPPNDFMRRTAKQKRQAVLADYRQRLKRNIIELARQG